MKKKIIKKITNEKLSLDYLKTRASFSERLGHSKQKWIVFAEHFINQGYDVYLYEARKTFSKYISVVKDGRSFKVRYSNHKPIEARELRGDCDFFVGVTHTGVTTISGAITATERFFQQCDRKGAA